MSKVEAYLRRLEKELLAKPLYSGIFNAPTLQQLPAVSCVYILWDNQKIQCIEESSNLKETCSKISLMLKSIDSKKNTYFTNIPHTKIPLLELSYIPMRIGRQELKEHLISIYRPPYYFMVLPQLFTLSKYHKIKLQYSNAYLKWTDEETKLLLREFTQGTSLTTIAKLLNRNYGAIYTKLKKLGLLPYRPSIQKSRNKITNYPTQKE